MNRHTFIRSSLAAVAVLAFAGCSHMHSSSSSSEYGSSGGSMLTETYTATLTPGEEVPPAADSQGKGTFEMHLDIKTNEFTLSQLIGKLCPRVLIKLLGTRFILFGSPLRILRPCTFCKT